ncbi:chitotriosidase-1-like [Gigantopelta aegis]|uniref:chitotriosidase-1-like n=1 Tax=Gigantopelta aegis TaxID=1735272 RepID=UPI001B88B3FA|nr:chitotriosidase-1-like [Gigantopelta aegis]
MKMWTVCGLLLIVACIVCQAQNPCNYKVVCYFPNWYQYKADPYRYVPSSIDPHLCTHILYAFAKVTPDAISITRYEPNDDAMIAQILALKNQNPNLKVLLAVGGWTHGPALFSAVAATDGGIDVWAGNVIAYLRQRRLDGLDVDWEYPVGRGSPASDKQRFSIFLQRVRNAFDAEAASTGKPRLELAIAVNAGRYFSDVSYERNKIGSYVDFISLMTYDFHGTWERQAGHHSQLHSSVYDVGANAELNMEYAVNYWISILMMVTGLTFLKAKGLGGAMVWSLASDDFSDQSCGAGKSPLIRTIKQQLCPASVGQTTAATPTTRTTVAMTPPTTTAVTSPTSRVTTKPVTVITTSPATTTQTVTQDSSVASIESACVGGAWPGEWMVDPTDCSKFYRCVSFGPTFRIMYRFTCPHPQLLGFDVNKYFCNWKIVVPACTKN